MCDVLQCRSGETLHYTTFSAVQPSSDGVLRTIPCRASRWTAMIFSPVGLGVLRNINGEKGHILITHLPTIPKFWKFEHS